MAGFDGNDVAKDAFAAEHEVANQVERLVAGELVVETNGLFGHDLVAADDDCILK